MKKIFFFSVLLFIIVVSFPLNTSADTFNRALWKYQTTVQTPAVSSEGLSSLLLGRPILPVSGIVPNIRIMDKNGEEVPYESVNLAEADKPIPSEISDLSINNEVSFIVDTGNNTETHSNIWLHIDGKNYKRSVSIYAFDSKLPFNSGAWRLITDQGYIYNYTDDRANFSNTGSIVSYPKTTARFLKVVIKPGEGKIDAVNSVYVTHKYESLGVQEDSFMTPVSIKEDGEKNITTVEINFENTEIVRNVFLDSSDSNFNRRAVLSYEDKNGNWVSAGAAYFFGVDTNLLKKKVLEAEFPDVFANKIKIEIINYNDRPLSIIDQATIIYPKAGVVFKAIKGETYTLYYGADSVSLPTYDLGSSLQYANLNKIPEAVIGNPTLNSNYVAPKGPEIPITEKYGFIFNTALILLVALLGILIFLYLRKVKNLGSNYR